MVVGGVALAMLLAVEFLVVVPLSGQDPVNGVIERDPVTGAAYALSLLVFAALPALISVPRADAR